MVRSSRAGSSRASLRSPGRAGGATTCGAAIGAAGDAGDRGEITALGVGGDATPRVPGHALVPVRAQLTALRLVEEELADGIGHGNGIPRRHVASGAAVDDAVEES